MRRRPVLLLGGTGQLGGALRPALGARWPVVAPPRGEIDLADPGGLGHAVRRIAPGLIVNCAAMTDVDAAERDPQTAMAVNGTAPGVLAGEARRGGVPLVHFSTDYVFGGEGDAPAGGWRETDPPAPVNRYGASKLAGERAVALSGAAHLILRLSWVYGRAGHNLLATVRALIAQNDEVRFVADQFGSPTWTNAIADATVRILARHWRADEGGLGDAGGLYHLAASGQASRYDFARAVADATGAAVRVIPVGARDFADDAPRPACSALDSGAARRRLGVALPDWRAQLRACLEQDRD